VRKIPPPTTNSPTIMITTWFENPDRASAGVNILNNIRRMSAHKATRSERILPLTKKIVATANMNNVMYIFGKSTKKERIKYQYRIKINCRDNCYLSKKKIIFVI